MNTSLLRALSTLMALALLLACSAAPASLAKDKAETRSSEQAFGAPEAKKLAEPAAEPGSPVAPYTERKLVKTGSATVETPDTVAAEKALTERVTGLGGFVESVQASESSRSLTLRIPAASFDTVLAGLPALGRVTDRQANVSDVTTQFYDLETRLKNQRLLLDQYRAVLAKTTKMADVLEAMAKISDLTNEIESTEGQFRYLGTQVALSTLHVDLVPPYLAQGRAWPDASSAFSDLVHTLADFGMGLLFFLLGAVVIVPVLFGLVALAVWLSVGKPGLWRLLKKLKHREGAKP